MFVLTPALVFVLQIQITFMSEYYWLFYLLGEQHGFRQAKNIKFSLDGEFYFYSRVFDFDAPDIDVDVSHLIVV